MDARMLDNLTKRELEKYLGVTKKSHQSSIVHGITFLRMMKYDRKVSFDASTLIVTLLCLCC